MGAFLILSIVPYMTLFDGKGLDDDVMVFLYGSYLFVFLLKFHSEFSALPP